ncbi:MAG: glycosyltransferase family 4 protein [Armatimonadota bacterium]
MVDQVLAILAPRLGVVSETFVRRHICEILPGRTVVAARQVAQDGWVVPAPLLNLRAYPQGIGALVRPFGWWRLDRRGQALRTFLREHGVTAVMGEWLNFTASWYPVLRGLGLRFYAHSHGYDISAAALASRRNLVLYRHLHAMDGIITVSRLARERLIQTCGLDPSKIHVIPCGVEIPPLPDRRRQGGPVICLQVGRLTEKKGPLHTLQAFAGVYRQCPELRLEFIGDGAQRAACERFCAEHGLAQVVTLYGSRPPSFVQERLREADIFLLHSLRARDGNEEGLPVAILEAMAHGLPVISTRHGGIPEAVADGATGCLVKEGDWEDMGRHLLALARDPARRLALGLEGRARAMASFSAEHEIRQLRALLLGGRSADRVAA